MKKELLIPVLKDTLKRYLPPVLLWTVFSATFGIVSKLYRIPPEPVSYGMLLTGAVLLILIVSSFAKGLRRSFDRKRALDGITSCAEKLPPAVTLGEADFRAMAEALMRRLESVIAENEEERKDMSDYYTAWVHQIKTPISVMRMQLAEKDDDGSRALRNELFRIEQYVDMVLQYIRLSSSETDLVIKEYELDEIIRSSVRKYASAFIQRKLRLSFEPTGMKTVTDSKWLGVIIDQILSNAVKYTPEGSVSIYRGDNDSLVIRDTGIGIAPEDLPRIFEKGYTGENGRADTRSSGLGLYLVKKAADRLSVKIDVESSPGAGTAFILHLDQDAVYVPYGCPE